MMMENTEENWGQLTVIDLYSCNPDLFNEKELTRYCLKLCEVVDMKPHGEPVIKKFGKGSLYGISLVHFIETSTIVIHIDQKANRVFVDIFSCKVFNDNKIFPFTKQFFEAGKIAHRTMLRG